MKNKLSNYAIDHSMSNITELDKVIKNFKSKQINSPRWVSYIFNEDQLQSKLKISCYI